LVPEHPLGCELLLLLKEQLLLLLQEHQLLLLQEDLLLQPQLLLLVLLLLLLPMSCQVPCLFLTLPVTLSHRIWVPCCCCRSPCLGGSTSCCCAARTTRPCCCCCWPGTCCCRLLDSRGPCCCWPPYAHALCCLEGLLAHALPLDCHGLHLVHGALQLLAASLRLRLESLVLHPGVAQRLLCCQPGLRIHLQACNSSSGSNRALVSVPKTNGFAAPCTLASS
jgi:hypothetical protein